MATTTFSTMIPTPSKKAVAKRPGPPVPPRPHQSTLFKVQRDTTATTTISKVGVEQHHADVKKPTTAVPLPVNNGVNGGRTIVYKSPSLNFPKRQEDREKQRSDAQPQIQTTKANAVTQTGSKITSGTHAPKPPLKLRKAPDIPTSKPPAMVPKADVPTIGNADNNNSTNNNTNSNSNIVVVALNRHHSMNTPSHAKPTANLKDTRLSLGRADFERVGKVQLNQLQPTSQPLPRPRKIVKIPVATLDMGESNSNGTTSLATSTNHISLFKRSKTTLDNFTSRSHITTVATGNTGSFLTGKTVEIKNNLKNAAERLFSEIMIVDESVATLCFS